VHANTDREAAGWALAVSAVTLGAALVVHQNDRKQFGRLADALLAGTALATGMAGYSYLSR